MSIQRMRQIIADAGYGFLATVAGDQPRVRPMSFVVLDDGRLWSSTYGVSGKVAELRDNARVEIAFVDGRKHHLRVEGTVDLSGGLDAKQRLLELNPKVKRHFPTADDPRLVHIEVRPSRARCKPPGFSEYEELDLPG